MTSHQPSNLHGSASLADQDRDSRPSICLSAGCMLRSNCPHAGTARSDWPAVEWPASPTLSLYPAGTLSPAVRSLIASIEAPVAIKAYKEPRFAGYPHSTWLQGLHHLQRVLRPDWGRPGGHQGVQQGASQHLQAARHQARGGHDDLHVAQEVSRVGVGPGTVRVSDRQHSLVPCGLSEQQAKGGGRKSGVHSLAAQAGP